MKFDKTRLSLNEVCCEFSPSQPGGQKLRKFKNLTKSSALTKAKNLATAQYDDEKNDGKSVESEKSTEKYFYSIGRKENNVELDVQRLDLSKFIQFSIFGCTLVIVIVNFGLLVLGIFLKTDTTFSRFLGESYRQTVKEPYTVPSLYSGVYCLVVFSVLCIILAFTGCCGVIRGNICMLVTAFLLFFVMFLLQLSGAILWYLKKDSIENELAMALDYMVQHYYQGAGIVQEVLDSLQSAFRCCGNAGCSDFTTLRLSWPRTCDSDCYGCRDRIFRVIRDGITVVFIFGGAMLIAELITIIGLMYLICRLKEKQNGGQESKVAHPSLSVDSQSTRETSFQ